MDRELPYRAVAPPRKQRLSDAIARQIEELIVDGSLRPGELLPAERVLAQRFGVSRPSLREALLMLEARGLLKVGRNAGFAVTDVTAPTITDPFVHLLRSHPQAEQDILEMRHGLEMSAAQFAAERATAKDRARLRQAYDHLIKTRAKRDALANADADVAFHLAITEASHNVALIHVMHGIHNLLRTFMHHKWGLLYEEPESVERITAQHRTLLDAVLAGDPDRAKEAAHLHISYVRQTVHQVGAGSAAPRKPRGSKRR